jgi:hypothetical protein
MEALTSWACARTSTEGHESEHCSRANAFPSLRYEFVSFDSPKLLISLNREHMDVNHLAATNQRRFEAIITCAVWDQRVALSDPIICGDAGVESENCGCPQ